MGAAAGRRHRERDRPADRPGGAQVRDARLGLGRSQRCEHRARFDRRGGGSASAGTDGVRGDQQGPRDPAQLQGNGDPALHTGAGRYHLLFRNRQRRQLLGRDLVRQADAHRKRDAVAHRDPSQYRRRATTTRLRPRHGAWPPRRATTSATYQNTHYLFEQRAGLRLGGPGRRVRTLVLEQRLQHARRDRT